MALDRLLPAGGLPAAAAVSELGEPSKLLLLLLLATVLAFAAAAFRAASSRPAAAATELVVTDKSGTLSSLVVVLNILSATPTPASCMAPAGSRRQTVQDMKHGTAAHTRTQLTAQRLQPRRT